MQDNKKKRSNILEKSKFALIQSKTNSKTSISMLNKQIIILNSIIVLQLI